MINILIVEESRTYNETLSAVIKKSNNSIYQAYNIKEAIEIIQNNDIHYIVSNIYLSDGTVKDLFEYEININKIKVMILSACENSSMRNELFDLGIVDFFTKDSSLKELVDNIHKKIDILEDNANKNILIIDNDKTSKKKLEKLLANKNYNTHSTDNLEHAINKIKKTHFDLIYFDINIPNVNGIKFIQDIKKEEKLKNIPIILLSKDLCLVTYTNALRNGATDYIKKPFIIEEILLKTELYILKSLHLNEIAAQAKELEEYKKILNQSDIVSLTNPNGIIKEVNENFCITSGFTKDELIGRTHSIVNHPDMPKETFKKLWQKVKNKETFKGIIKNRRKDGSAYYVDATISPILDVKGNIKEIIGIRHDVTRFMNPKNQLIADLKITKRPLLIFLQITNYNLLKEFYSESIMHNFESKFEKNVLNYFPSYVKFKKVYNLGNGLFAFLKTQEFNLKEIYEYLNNVLEMFDNLGISFKENNYDIDICLAFATQGEHILDDVYMGIQKAVENKISIVYSNDLYKLKQEEASKKLNSIKSIKEALNGNGEFVSFFQPIQDNRIKQVVKYESLIRLINKNKEIISPFFFLDTAKRTGYYADITKIVIKNAAKFLELTDKEVAINLSASDIENKSIREELLNLVKQPRNRGRLTFELLEDEDIKNFDLVKNFILEAKRKGKVKIAIDDFGSGYSSYERLLAFEPDILKIDGSLIKNIAEDSSLRNVVQSIVLFAKQQKIKTVAEFVSSKEILDIVTYLGVDYSQGYYLGEPKRFF